VALALVWVVQREVTGRVLGAALTLFATLAATVGTAVPVMAGTTNGSLNVPS
jgi:hypothetical protein